MFGMFLHSLMECVGGGRLVSSILLASKVWSPDDQSRDLMLHFSHITSATCDYLDTLADSIEAVVQYLPSPFLHPGVLPWGGLCGHMGGEVFYI